MRGKSPQNSAAERTTTIANLVKHRNLQRFSGKLWVNAAPNWKLWVNAAPNWLKSAWVDWDSALYKMGQWRTRLETTVRL